MPTHQLALKRYVQPTQVHVHDYHQLVLPSSGSMKIEVEGLADSIGPGRGVFVRAGAEHHFSACPTSLFVVVDVSITTARLLGAHSMTSGSAFVELAADCESLMRYLIAALDRLSSRKDLQLSWLAHMLESLGMCSKDVAITGREERLVRAAQEYVRCRLAEPISVRDVANFLASSEGTLYAAFRRHSGTSPGAEIARMRLEEALCLLETTDLPIAEIALRTGHSDQSALTRRMRQLVGITPARHRREHRHTMRIKI